MRTSSEPAALHAQARRNHELIGRLLDAPPSPATTALLDCLSDWMEAYEQLHVPMPRVSPVDALRQLMAANGLRQIDLAEDFGGQPVVSAVLRGKRRINLRQAQRLAQRFQVSAMLFIGDANSSDGADARA